MMTTMILQIGVIKSQVRHKRVLIHERDEESGCEENNNSFDCIKKSTKFRNKCVLSDSKESDSGKNHRTHNNKKHSSKVTYKRVRTYDSDEVSDGDIQMHFPVLINDQMKLGKIIPTLFYERNLKGIKHFYIYDSEKKSVKIYFELQ